MIVLSKNMKYINDCLNIKKNKCLRCSVMRVGIHRSYHIRKIAYRLLFLYLKYANLLTYLYFLKCDKNEIDLLEIL